MTETISATEYKALPVSEHKLQVRVFNYLQDNAKENVFGFAITNAAKRSYRLGARMKAEGLTAGVADLCVMLPGGRAAWLEMKTAKGRQSIEQKGFAARCLRLGHPYAVAKSFDEAVKVLRLWGALR
jgi:hypothetical protein